MTKVIFRVHNVRGEEAEVIAFFPELPGTLSWWKDCLSYIHVGQHGASDIKYFRNFTRPATPDEYKDLLTELQQVYDGQLKPVTRMTLADMRKRREAVG